MNAVIDGRARELPWVGVARTYVGLAEIPGKQDNPTIERWLREARAWWDDDETPWCGTFLRAVMVETAAQWPGLGLMPPPKHWYRALAWNDYGYPVVAPTYGAIVTFNRKGGGHVGLCVGRDADWRPMILGGNQGNRVSILPFEPDRIASVRFPTLGYLVQNLPLVASNGLPLSTNEA